MRLVHTRQTSGTCMSACIAMLTGQTLEQVVEEFHNDFISGMVVPSEYLSSKGMQVSLLDAEFRGWFGNEIYLILAPSLNLEAEMHALILDRRDPEKHILHDPNRGREGKKYYILRTDREVPSKNEVFLGGYVPSFMIHGWAPKSNLKQY